MNNVISKLKACFTRELLAPRPEWSSFSDFANTDGFINIQKS